MNFLFEDGAHPARPRSSALGVSLLVHGVAIFLAVTASPALPKRSPSEYRQKIEGRDTKIVWYKFRKQLPRVVPVRAERDNRPLRAETKSAQSIVSSPKAAPKRIQTILTPAPELAPAHPLELPNMLAVKLQPKQFVAPPVLQPPDAARPQLAPDAPSLDAKAAAAADLHLRLPPKEYVAPPVRIAVPRLIATADAPPLQAASAPLTESAAMVGAKLPPRSFSPPAPKAVAAARAVSMEAPSSPDAVNVAVIGLNPLDKAAALPTMSSRAEFSAGPQPRATGATSEGKATGLALPGLFVRGTRDARPDLIAEAYAAPTSPQALRAAIRNAEPMARRFRRTPRCRRHGRRRKVSGAPDPRFNGRDVYMMAIQMPNLTSYSGSWLMWYADRTAREAGLAPIAPPVPHRKVDPKYVADRG